MNLRYTELQCPGMRDILAMAPKDQQSALVRGILYQWCIEHQDAGTLTQAIITTLSGPGVSGERSLRKSGKPRSRGTRINNVQSTTRKIEHLQAVPAQVTSTPRVDINNHAGPLFAHESNNQVANEPKIEDTAAVGLFDILNE